MLPLPFLFPNFSSRRPCLVPTWCLKILIGPDLRFQKITVCNAPLAQVIYKEVGTMKTGTEKTTGAGAYRRNLKGIGWAFGWAGSGFAWHKRAVVVLNSCLTSMNWLHAIGTGQKIHIYRELLVQQLASLSLRLGKNGSRNLRWCKSKTGNCDRCWYLSQ